LTDNSVQFSHRERNTQLYAHVFNRACAENGIEHRLSKVAHPWINGQVERMNRILKKATVKRYRRTASTVGVRQPADVS
jgi:transposase InsO family protein